MFQVRIQGCDDVGVVTTAELLAAAATADGRRVKLAAPASGAPAIRVCVIDGAADDTAPGLSAPDTERADEALVVQDTWRLSRCDTFAGLSEEAYVLVNSACGFGDLGVNEQLRRFCRDRTLILPVTALQPGASCGAAVSACMLGGLAALCGVVTPASVASATRDRVPGLAGRACADAACLAYDFVRAERAALAA
jgi:pyruvate ferredoxin oxidoreductase gamma subunit